ncbi:hypothetical protein EJB05_48424 [Eragrostis curvula]|uniref:Cation-transporting P-type ATPase N-terminal domain-containing protein n=1 Tax=Eragrostis curvula TaxID=38414 RepID=A0A5J9T1L3_9POAL|nr:hypothetical protein EJB05_48424 [Eragrostis curvula]
MKRSNQEKLRVAVLVSKAALQFLHGLPPPQEEYTVPADVAAAGFGICAEELSSIIEGHDLNRLTSHDGVDGILSKLSTSASNGLAASDEAKLSTRRELFGVNRFAEAEPRGFWVFIWEALHDMTLMILAACALVSLAVGVTRGGFRRRLPIHDLLAGDVAHLAVGDQVPANGLFVSGFSLLIDESSLTGESEPVAVAADNNPFLLSGTKVQDGACRMVVTTVGMRTQWGKLMATLSEGGDDETPLQVKLNGVATVIGKVGLAFAVVITFAVLTQGLLVRKLAEGTWLLR